MNLTESLLDVTRIEYNTLKIKPEIVDLNDIILNVIKYFTDELEKHNYNKNICMCEFLPYSIKRKDKERSSATNFKI